MRQSDRSVKSRHAGRSVGPAGRSRRAAGDRDPAGLLLARLSVAPALIAAAFLLVSFPLLVIGGVPPGSGDRPDRDRGDADHGRGLFPWRGRGGLPGLHVPPVSGAAAADPRLWAQPGDHSAAATPGARRGRFRSAWPVIAAGFFAFQAAYHSQFLVISRDPGAYMQFGAWIARHGSLPIQTSRRRSAARRASPSAASPCTRSATPLSRSSWRGCRWCWRGYVVLRLRRLLTAPLLGAAG